MFVVVIILFDDENYVCYIILFVRLCKFDYKIVCICILKNKVKICYLIFFY